MILGVNEEYVQIDHEPAPFLKCLRGLMGLTQAEFANKCDISIHMIKRIEGGDRFGSLELWGRIANVSGIDLIVLTNELCGAATDLLDEVHEDIAMGESGDMRLYYLIGMTGKLWICDSDYFDEDTEGRKYIVATPDEAARMLELQQKELGS